MAKLRVKGSIQRNSSSKKNVPRKQRSVEKRKKAKARKKEKKEEQLLSTDDDSDIEKYCSVDEMMSENDNDDSLVLVNDDCGSIGSGFNEINTSIESDGTSWSEQSRKAEEEARARREAMIQRLLLAQEEMKRTRRVTEKKKLTKLQERTSKSLARAAKKFRLLFGSDVSKRSQNFFEKVKHYKKELERQEQQANKLQHAYVAKFKTLKRRHMRVLSRAKAAQENLKNYQKMSGETAGKKHKQFDRQNCKSALVKLKADLSEIQKSSSDYSPLLLAVKQEMAKMQNCVDPAFSKNLKGKRTRKKESESLLCGTNDIEFLEEEIIPKKKRKKKHLKVKAKQSNLKFLKGKRTILKKRCKKNTTQSMVMQL
eukprot:g709.t1